MKKYIIAIYLIFLICIFASCSNKEIPLSQYQGAVKKTEEITKGKSSFEMIITNDYYTELLSNEEKELLENYKELQFDNITSFDNTQDKMETYGYIYYGGVGNDFEVYKDGNKMSIKLPMIGKYMLLDSDNSITADQINENEIYEKIIKPISDKWLSMLKNENVVKGEKSILTTEDGDIKIIKYSINPSSDQMKEFLAYVINLLYQNKDLFSQYVSIEDSNLNIEDLKNNAIEIFTHLESIDYKEIAYIDVDGYIPQQDLEISINFSKNDAGIKGINTKIKTKTWEIEREQDIQFPQITDENTMDLNSNNTIKDIIGGNSQ